jgi:hypothetical protein
MEREGAVRGLLLGLAVLWLQGCATGAVATGGLLPEVGLLPEGTHGVVLLGEVRRQEPELSEARRAEVECALAQAWGVARGVEEEGARVELRFWAQGGALTLLSHHTRGGQGRAEPVEEASFEKELRRLLTDYVGERTGEVVFTLHRERGRWLVDFRGDSDVPRPLEAKTQPVRREGVSVGTYAAITQVAGEMVRLVGGPAGSGASFSAKVALEDDGVAGWEPGPYEGAGREVDRGARERLQGELIQALLPFTHGVGRREVRLTLQGVHRPGEPSGSWRVVVAETLQPPVSHGEEENLLAEYRALHETILREWREEVVDSGRLALRMGTEELAWWVIGGVVAHGGGAVLKEVAPRLVETLLRGGARAQGWLNTLLQRLSKAERDAFNELWKRVDLGGGGRSLTQAEQRELSRFAKQLEELIEIPLNKDEKRRLRSVARADFFRAHPELAKQLVNKKGAPYPVHHRRPLEYAQLFPGEDINALMNLRAVDEIVHDRINAVWTVFRSERSPVRAADVDEVVAIIDRHFDRWYNVIYDNGSASTLAEAEVAAIAEVRGLMSRFRKTR